MAADLGRTVENSEIRSGPPRAPATAGVFKMLSRVGRQLARHMTGFHGLSMLTLTVGACHEDNASSNAENSTATEVQGSGPLIEEKKTPMLEKTDQDQDGYSAWEDCNDNDATIHPGADDPWYDGIDQDCKGNNDYDADGDESPSPEDCNDENPAIHPKAEEICENGMDDNCTNDTREQCPLNFNGTVEELQNLPTTTQWVGDGAEGSGTGAENIGDSNGDGYPEIAISSESYGVAGDSYGRVCVLTNALSGGTVLLDNAHTCLIGNGKQDRLGTAVAGGDLNGDGFSDLVVSDQNDRVDVVNGPFQPFHFPLYEVSAANRVGLNGEGFGSALAVMGDQNNDGISDLAIGIKGADENRGAIELYSGSEFGSDVGPIALLLGNEEMGEAGTSLVAPGDVNGDGTEDLMVGAPGVNNEAGAVYRVAGPIEEDFNLETQVTVEGGSIEERFGSRLAAAGDIDLDGYNDVVAGAPGNSANGNSAGQVFVLCGPITEGKAEDTACAAFKGEQSGDKAGGYGLTVSDFNGDGYPELVVGVPYSEHGINNGGAVHTVLGPLRGKFDGLAQATEGGTITGFNPWDEVGWALTSSQASCGVNLILTAPARDYYAVDNGISTQLPGTCP